MKASLRGLTGFAVAFFLLSGCGQKTASQLSSADLKAFDSASPETKQMWSAGLAASKTNDYVAGQMILFKLMNQELTPEQREAVNKESTALNERLYAAAEKGDPAAQKAVQEMRANPPSRQR